MKNTKVYLLVCCVGIIGLVAFLVGRPLVEHLKINRFRTLIQIGDVDGVKRLAERDPWLLNADLGERHGDHLKTLSIAAGLGEIDICSNLIRLGENVNEQDKYRYTPLHYAAMADQTNVAELLIRERADPTIKDFEGMTPVELAQKFNASSNLIQILKQTR